MSVADKFQKDMDHIWVAYCFLDQAVPSESSDLPLCLNGFEFHKKSQITSIRVELGWAFYTRLEACLETLLHRLEIKLTRNKSLLDLCSQKDVALSLTDKQGLNVYRELRNVLHHADGDPANYSRDLRHLKVEDGKEPRLHREHIENFYKLFRKVGTALAQQGAAL